MIPVISCHVNSFVYPRTKLVCSRNCIVVCKNKKCNKKMSVPRTNYHVDGTFGTHNCSHCDFKNTLYEKWYGIRYVYDDYDSEEDEDDSNYT